MNRRTFLALAATTGLTACRTGPANGSQGIGAANGPHGTGRPPALRNRLRVPPLVDPEPGADGVRRFELTAQTGHSLILPGPATPTWGFNGDHLGPTLRVTRGDLIEIAVTNALEEPTNVHWHGMRPPAAMDGGPHRTVGAGAAWTARWTVDQPAATAWYHPHTLGTTAAHLYRGLAGMLIVADATDPRLPSSYGVDDIPLILQDKRIAPDGALAGDPRDGVLGDRLLVNGTFEPYLQVTTERVRLRVVNASGTRRHHLAFADGRLFHVVGNDAGLLAESVEVDRVSLAPGERVELVVEFWWGETAVLRGLGGDDAGPVDVDVLAFVAAPRLARSRRVRRRLTGLPPVPVPPGATVRRIRLDERGTVNGRPPDPSRIDEVVPAAATEIWEVENAAAHARVFHIRSAAFEVLDVDGDPPPPYATGRKDTVHLPAESRVRLAVRFGGYADPGSPYLYHSASLRRGDPGVMGRFVVVQPGTEHRTPRTLVGPAATTEPDDLQ